MTTELIHHFEKGLHKLIKEIEAYKDEEALWITTEPINNSAGNLCAHIVGNLNHYIGVGMGNTGYIRDRPGEFSDKNVPRAELVSRVEATIQMIKEVLPAIPDLYAEYPIHHFREEGSIAKAIFRVLNHLYYHLGQINYHRRLLAS